MENNHHFKPIWRCVYVGNRRGAAPASTTRTRTGTGWPVAGLESSSSGAFSRGAWGAQLPTGSDFIIVHFEGMNWNCVFITFFFLYLLLVPSPFFDFLLSLPHQLLYCRSVWNREVNVGELLFGRKLRKKKKKNLFYIRILHDPMNLFMMNL